MKVLYVGELPPRAGGASQVATAILRGLAAAGDRVHAVAPLAPEQAGGDPGLADLALRVSVSRYDVPHLASGWFRGMTRDYRLLERARARAAVQALVLRFRPDVLLLGKTVYAWHLADLATMWGLPSVLVCQGAWASELWQHPEADELLAQVGRVTEIVAVARHLEAPLRRLGLERLRVVPNGIDLERFAPGPPSPALRRALAIPSDAVVVLHVSNLVEVKRPLDLVRSARAALAEEPDLVYVVAGEGPLRGAMETACREAGILERFRFAGWVPSERMPAFYHLADVVAMPSESEALPLVHLEAQACGRVLLASDIPAGRELVVAGDNGLLFRTGDVADLTARTLQAACDAGLRCALGRRAREAVQGYTLDRMIAGHRGALSEARQRVLEWSDV